MLSEVWLSPKQIAKKYNVSYDTARRWIISICGNGAPPKQKGHRQRPRRMRRVPLSLLEKHIDEFLN